MPELFVYSGGGNSSEPMVRKGVGYYFVKDHRSSILKVVDVRTGEVKQELKYSKFGEVLQNISPRSQSGAIRLERTLLSLNT